jgi:hypothetical protein
MFDNLTPNQNNTPSPIIPPLAPMGGGANPPKMPEDMFAEVKDIPAKPAVLQPKNNMPQIGFDDNAGRQADMKKYFVLVMIILVIVLLLAGAVISYKYFFKSKNTATPAIDTAQEQKNTNQETPAVTEPQNTEPTASAPVENQNNIIIEPETASTSSTEITPPTAASNTASSPNSIIDTDQDGLTDEEEKSLGTDITKTDSDNDGLFDRDEVKVYKTNPQNADTDGDGFLDGEEVQKGYNPLGPGKLYEIK